MKIRLGECITISVLSHQWDASATAAKLKESFPYPYSKQKY